MLDMYAALIKLHVASQLQYRIALFIYQIGIFLEPTVYLVVWATVAEANGGQVEGYSVADFAAYFIATMLVNQFTRTWTMYEFDTRIRYGELSAQLLRPMHPIHNDLADNLASKIITLVVYAATTVGLIAAFHPVFQSPPWVAFVFWPAIFLAFALRFVLEWVLAMIAFWTIRTDAVNQVFVLIVLFFSGQFAPLALLPAPLQLAATILPFRWMIAFPISLLLGQLTLTEAASGLLAQGVWLILSGVLLKFVWRAGLRHYSAVGA